MPTFIYKEVNFCVILLLVVVFSKIASVNAMCFFDGNCTGDYRKCCSNKCVSRKNCDGSCNGVEDCAPNDKCVDDKCVAYCNSRSDCLRSPYKQCCNNLCSYRRRCYGSCSRKSDCLNNEYCVKKKCTENRPLNYCDGISDCYSHEKCEDNLCVAKCDCGPDEECSPSGKCERKSSFSTASIVGFIVVVIIGSCIACVVYCGCARTAGRQQQQQHNYQHQQQQRQHHLQLMTRQGTGDVTVTEINGGPPSPPIHPGGPPPYHSLERLHKLDEPPPPSYEDALRNSNSNLNTNSDCV